MHLLLVILAVGAISLGMAQARMLQSPRDATAWLERLAVKAEAAKHLPHETRMVLQRIISDARAAPCVWGSCGDLGTAARKDMAIKRLGIISKAQTDDQEAKTAHR